LRILILAFSFALLFATDVKIKFAPQTSTLYIYTISKNRIKSFKVQPFMITQGDILEKEKFSFWHNDKFYIGEKFRIFYHSKLEVLPLKVYINNREYKTPKFVYNRSKIKNFDINLEFPKPRKNDFWSILAFIFFAYILALLYLMNKKKKEFLVKSGVFESDIKKFYYYVLKNYPEKIESLNKYRNYFSKKLNEFDYLIKELQNDITKKYKNEIIIFGILFILALLQGAI